MTIKDKSSKDVHSTTGKGSPSKRIEPDGTVVYSFYAALDPAILNDEREKLRDQNRRNSHARDVMSRKPLWQDHVRARASSGDPIHSLADLKQGLEKDHPALKAADPTLKNWAKEALPGLNLRSGRPPKK